MGNSQIQESPIGILLLGLIFCIVIVLCMVNMLTHPSMLLFSIISLTPSVIILTIIEGIGAGCLLFIWFLWELKKIINLRLTDKSSTMNKDGASMNLNHFRRSNLKPKSLFILSIFLGISLIGYIFCDINYGGSSLLSYANLSYVCIVLLILTFFFDSDFIRAHVWCIIPGITYIIWNVMLNETATLQNEFLLINIPVFILISFYIGTFQRTNWWMIPIACADWILYLVILHAISPSSYSGQFPYIYGSLLVIIAISSGIVLILFIFINSFFSDQVGKDTNSCQANNNQLQHINLELQEIDLINPPQNAIFIPKAIVNKEILPYLQNNPNEQMKVKNFSPNLIFNGPSIQQLHKNLFVINGPLGELCNIAYSEKLPIILSESSYNLIKNTLQGPAFIEFLSSNFDVKVLNLAKNKDTTISNEYMYAKNMGWQIPEITNKSNDQEIDIPNTLLTQDLLTNVKIEDNQYNILFNEDINNIADKLANFIYDIYIPKKLSFESSSETKIDRNNLIIQLGKNYQSGNAQKIKIGPITNFYSVMFALAAEIWFHDKIKDMGTEEDDEDLLEEEAPVEQSPPIDKIKIVICQQPIDSIKMTGPTNPIILFPSKNDTQISKNSPIKEFTLDIYKMDDGKTKATKSGNSIIGYSFCFDLDWQKIDHFDELEKQMISSLDKAVISEYAGVYLGLYFLGHFLNGINFWTTDPKSLKFKDYQVINRKRGKAKKTTATKWQTPDYATQNLNAKDLASVPIKNDDILVESKGSENSNLGKGIREAENQILGGYNFATNFKQGFVSFLVKHPPNSEDKIPTLVLEIINISTR